MTLDEVRRLLAEIRPPLPVLRTAEEIRAAEAVLAKMIPRSNRNGSDQ